MTLGWTIQRCNLFVWDHLHPRDDLQFQSDEHRNLCRMYFLAVVDLELSQGGNVSSAVLALLKEMNNPHWTPDDRFRKGWSQIDMHMRRNSGGPKNA